MPNVSGLEGYGENGRVGRGEERCMGRWEEGKTGRWEDWKLGIEDKRVRTSPTSYPWFKGYGFGVQGAYGSRLLLQKEWV